METHLIVGIGTCRVPNCLCDPFKKMAETAETLLAEMKVLQSKLAMHGYEISVNKSAGKAITKKEDTGMDWDSLRFPLLITGFYLLSLQRWAATMKEETEASGQTVFDVWNSPPVVGSCECVVVGACPIN